VRLRRARFLPIATGNGPRYHEDWSVPVVLAWFRRALTDMEPVENPPPVPEGVPARALRRSFFRDVPWRWRDVLFCFAPSVISRPVRGFLPLTLVGWLQWLWLPLTLVDQAWLMGYTLWAARNRRGALPGLPGMRRILAELRWVHALVPAAFAAMIAVYSVATWVLESPEPPNEGWAPVMRSASRAELVGLAILAMSVAPIAEELAFRGLLYNKLRQALPASLALVLQAVAFGMAHYPLAIEFACAIGAVALMIGLFYEWRKTLVAPVLLHASINMIGLAVLLANVAADAASPRLGVSVVAGDQGCVVTVVAAGSTADRAGLRVGDVITALDGTAVRNLRELRAIVRQKRVGDRVAIDYTRLGTPQRVEAVLTAPDR
jgi:membrane protease YdiL (CAAX protease family)